MIVRGGTFGPVATNTYVLADGQGGTAWIVDPAMGSAGWVEQTLARIGATPELVLNTHGHWDHVVENHVWAARGLPVWVAAEDAGWVRAPAPFNPALFGNPPPTPGVEPSRLLAEGDVLNLGDIEIAMMATPGHSPGCMVAYAASEGQAVVGDLVFAQGIGRTDFPGSDPRAMMASLERVFAELPGETLIHPGHGPWDVALADAERFARMFL
jgi:hydroxyacylglutathione hydrolase